MRRVAVIAAVVAMVAGSGSAPAEERDPAADETNSLSPTRGIQQPPGRFERGRRRPGVAPIESRSIDGSGNNLSDPEMGATFTQLGRLMPAGYDDGVEAMSGVDRPGAREVSNAVAAQSESIVNVLGATDYLWQWGQFVDHDLDLTDGADPAELANIPIPTGDPWFDPDGDGDVVFKFNRSLYDPDSGSASGTPRQQVNEISTWIDASNVYGSNEERAQALRTLDGSGRLATAGALLPYNTSGLPNAGGTSPSLFLAGDVRANEQVGLTSMHTLFVREHNRLAAQIGQREPGLSGDEIYERARRIVGAQMQIITYEEYLPALLGRGALSEYRGYRPNTDATIMNFFATAAYRYGHSALSPQILRLDADGNEIAEGHLSLSQAFFAPYRLEAEGGIEPVLRGLAAQACQRVDPLVIDDVRNFLFGAPGSGGLDLASLNIQRGRDHGLPGYNDARAAMGLPPAESFDDVTSNTELQQRLASVYVDVDQIDAWVGGLSEDPIPGSHLGPLFHQVVRGQFEALRDADRLWWEISLRGDTRQDITGTRLSDIIRRNTSIGDELQSNVFRLESDRDGQGNHGGHGNHGDQGPPPPPPAGP